MEAIAARHVRGTFDAVGFHAFDDALHVAFEARDLAAVRVACAAYTNRTQPSPESPCDEKSLPVKIELQSNAKPLAQCADGAEIEGISHEE